MPPQDVAASPKLDASDPFANDPPVHPALKLHASKPCTAELPKSLLLQSWVTPGELWYVRSHHPVPKVDATTHKLQVRAARGSPPPSAPPIYPLQADKFATRRGTRLPADPRPRPQAS